MTDITLDLTEFDVLAKVAANFNSGPAFLGSQLIATLTALSKSPYTAVPYARLGQDDRTALVRYIHRSRFQYVIVADGDAFIDPDRTYCDVEVWVIPRPRWAPRDCGGHVPLQRITADSRTEGTRVGAAIRSINRS